MHQASFISRFEEARPEHLMNLNSQPDNLLRETDHNYALADLRASGVRHSNFYSPLRHQRPQSPEYLFNQKFSYSAFLSASAVSYFRGRGISGAYFAAIGNVRGTPGCSCAFCSKLLPICVPLWIRDLCEFFGQLQFSCVPPPPPI